MEVTEKFSVVLDKETHEEIIDKIKVDVIELITQEELDRVTKQIERFEDNHTSIGFIDIKLKKMGITEQSYVLKARRLDLLESNERIIKSICRLLGVN